MSATGQQRGFSLVEVMVAMVILVIGLVSLLALFTQSIATMQLVQEDLIAKQKAREALESVYTARSSQQITFAQIQNISSGGIFQNGYQSLREAGPDGLFNTGDDGAIEILRRPGPNGQLGDPCGSDDECLQLLNFERDVLIQPVLSGGVPNPSLRQITVTIRYRLPSGQMRSYQVGSYISQFR